MGNNKSELILWEGPITADELVRAIGTHLKEAWQPLRRLTSFLSIWVSLSTSYGSGSSAFSSMNRMDTILRRYALGRSGTQRNKSHVLQPCFLPGSSTLLQTSECSEYHPSEQSPVVSALSLTRLYLSGTNSLFLSAILPVSSFKSSLKTFLFLKTFSSVSLPW